MRWIKSIFRPQMVEKIGETKEEDEKYRVIDGVWVNKPKNDNKEDFEKDETGVKISDLELISRFCEYLESKGLIKSSIIGYKSDLKLWAIFAKKKGYYLDQMSIEYIEKFYKNADPDTARRKIASLRSFAKWRLRNSISSLFIEVQKIDFKAKKARIPKSLDFEQYHDLKDNAKEMVENDDRRGIWLSLMSQCGLRIGEVKTAIPDTRKGFIRVIGKGNKERVVPCPDWLIEALKKDSNGNYKRVRQFIDRELKKIGYKKFHSLRHTYATKLLKEGVPIDKIKDLLGHASISTTQIYLKREVLENAPEYINKK